jgi:hypothetical protein
MTDEQDRLRRFLEAEVPTLPGDTAKSRILRDLTNIAHRVDALAGDVSRMDLTSETARLVIRRKVTELVRLLWGLGQFTIPEDPPP